MTYGKRKDKWEQTFRIFYQVFKDIVDPHNQELLDFTEDEFIDKVFLRAQNPSNYDLDSTHKEIKLLTCTLQVMSESGSTRKRKKEDVLVIIQRHRLFQLFGFFR